MYNENTRLLVICPTRGRPDTLKEMLQSFEDTKSEGTEIAIYVADDDPSLEKYKPILAKYTHEIGPRKYLVDVLNHFSVKVYPNVPYYSCINDDHVYQTIGWDKIFIDTIVKEGNGWGVCCGNDLLTIWKQWQHPSGEVISGNIIRTLGYYVYPKFQHIGTDDYMQRMSQGINRLFHLDDVIVEHRHWLGGKRKMDDNYSWAYSSDQQIYGMKILHEYRTEHYENDMIKLNTAMRLEGINI